MKYCFYFLSVIIFLNLFYGFISAKQSCQNINQTRQSRQKISHNRRSRHKIEKSESHVIVNKNDCVQVKHENNECCAAEADIYFTDRNTVLKLYQMMKDVHDVLITNGIEYWVAAGTLLGAVRHKGLIPWDDDLDICINQKQIKDFLNLKPIFKRLGYELIFLGGIHRLSRIFSCNGSTIEGDSSSKFPFMDIFSYNQEGNAIRYNWSSFANPREIHDVAIYADELYPIKDYAFGSFCVRGPNNPFKYLECCYGSNVFDVAYLGHNHQGKNAKGQMLQLTQKEKVPAQPLGPIKDNVLSMFTQNMAVLLSQTKNYGHKFFTEMVHVTKDNLEESLRVLRKVEYIFLQAFEKQAVEQLKKEHAKEYENLIESGKSIEDYLLARFNKIMETVILQIDLVDGLYITLLKTDTDVIVGYAIFYLAPINKIIQSMILRKYIKSVVSLSDEIINFNNLSDSDLYIVSLAVLPQFQKRGLGSQIISSILSHFSPAKNIYLLTAESETNVDAQQFYEHLNFQRKGVVLTSDENLKILYCFDMRQNTDELRYTFTMPFENFD